MKHYACETPFTMKDKDGNLYTLQVEQDECAESPRNWDNVAKMVCWSSRYSLGDDHDYDEADDFCRDMITRYMPIEHIIKYINSHQSRYCKIENDNLYGRYAFNNEWYLVGKACELEKDDLLAEFEDMDLYRLVEEIENIAILPLNLYDHGGITTSTSSGYPYNDSWDAGRVGWIYVTKERAMQEWGGIPELDENGEVIRVPHKHSDGSITYSAKYTPITEENWKEVAKYHMDNEVEVYDQYFRGDAYGYKLTKRVIENEVCPHCEEVIKSYEVDEEVDSCWGFYGDCLEENGIIDNINYLEFID